MSGISIVIPYYKDIYITKCVDKLIAEYNKLDTKKNNLRTF